MRAVDLIMKKRNKGALTPEEIRFIIKGYTDGLIPEYQVSALLMAIYFNGMTEKEVSVLTDAMIRSGRVMDLSEFHTVKLDKHSTGGVGDKVSLILAPLAACFDMKVPMMSGRGLGHTGGTLDKLESIPGYSTDLSQERFMRALAEQNFAMIGQSDDVVPADKQLYALRDVTGTVESVPLITASILSKKFAEGADGLVFDVKCGSGAFMKDILAAEELALSLVRTGEELGKKIKAVITDMETPLGYTVGNFLEVKEVIDCLKGEGPEDLMEVTYRLTGWMLVMAELAGSIEEAMEKCEAAIQSGKAFEKFRENVKFQGGDLSVIDNPENGPKAKFSKAVRAGEGGFITHIDAYKTGLASVVLGAGRSKKGDPVSAGAGLVFRKKTGDRVDKNDILCYLYTDKETLLEEAEKLMGFTISSGQVEKKSKILKEIG